MARLKLMRTDRGYRRNFLWLPKSRIKNMKGMKAALSFEREGEAPIYAWDESRTHLMVPREFVPISGYPDLGFDIEDQIDWNFPRVDFNPRSTSGTLSRPWPSPAWSMVAVACWS